MLRYKIVKRRNPMTKQPVYGAQLHKSTPLTQAQIVERIQTKCTLTSADIKAVLDALDSELTFALLQGNSVRLGDLGSFHLTMRSRSVGTPEAFEPSHIRGVNVRFTPSGKMARLLSHRTGSVQLLRSDKPKAAKPADSTPAPSGGGQ